MERPKLLGDSFPRQHRDTRPVEAEIKKLEARFDELNTEAEKLHHEIRNLEQNPTAVPNLHRRHSFKTHAIFDALQGKIEGLRETTGKMEDTVKELEEQKGILEQIKKGQE